MIPAFLLKNPLASILGVGAVLLAIALGVQTVRLAVRDTELATEKLAFSDFKKDLAEQSVKVMEAAAKRSADQIKGLADDIKSASTVATETKTEIRYVQSNGGPCTADPAWRATVGGVQRILDTPRGAGGQGGQAGPKSASVVRRAGAP